MISSPVGSPHSTIVLALRATPSGRDTVVVCAVARRSSARRRTLALDLDVVFLDHLGPALGLEFQLGQVLLGRGSGGDVAHLDESLLDIGALDDLPDQAVQPI